MAILSKGSFMTGKGMSGTHCCLGALTSWHSGELWQYEFTSWNNDNQYNLCWILCSVLSLPICPASGIECVSWSTFWWHRTGRSNWFTEYPQYGLGVHLWYHKLFYLKQLPLPLPFLNFSNEGLLFCSSQNWATDISKPALCLICFSACSCRAWHFWDLVNYGLISLSCEKTHHQNWIL